MIKIQSPHAPLQTAGVALHSSSTGFGSCSETKSLYH